MLHLLDPHEPAGDRPVQEGRVRPPAVGVTMLDGAGLDHPVNAFEVLDNVLVGILDILASKVSHLFGEFTYAVQRTHNLPILLDDSVSQAHAVVILSKVRSLKVVKVK